MFYSVDVETSSTNPFRGTLLTVGVVAINGQLEIVGDYYSAIANSLIDWDPETLLWWREQNLTAQNEIFGNISRQISAIVAIELVSFVHQFRSPEDDTAYFVANPSSFDYPWIVRLFTETEVLNPFHYRTLCLRSMKYGLVKESGFGSDRETHESEVPHHALSDAYAQALDLIEMLKQRDGV